MPFMMNCSNKGCYKNQTPTLDLRTNEVICSECGNVINGISPFIKNQMKSSGQTRKPPRPAYSVRCEKCRQESLPKLDGSNKLICSWCDNPLKNISAPFQILIRKAIAEGEQDL